MVPSHHVVSGEDVDGKYQLSMTLSRSYGACMCHTVGSVLLAYAGEGRDDGCFFQLSEDSTMTGFVVYYPNQDPKMVPKPYPWYVP